MHDPACVTVVMICVITLPFRTIVIKLLVSAFRPFASECI